MIVWPKSALLTTNVRKTYHLGATGTVHLARHPLACWGHAWLAPSEKPEKHDAGALRKGCCMHKNGSNLWHLHIKVSLIISSARSSAPSPWGINRAISQRSFEFQVVCFECNSCLAIKHGVIWACAPVGCYATMGWVGVGWMITFFGMSCNVPHNASAACETTFLQLLRLSTKRGCSAWQKI